MNNRMVTPEQRAYLQRMLNEHRHNVRTAVAAMGNGNLAQALPLAVTIRALIHETGRQKPLLKSLNNNFLEFNIHGMILATSANPLRIPLTAQITTAKPHLRLITERGNGGREARYPLGEWWTGPFVVVPDFGSSSRKDVIVGLADQQGAHVDTNIDEKLRQLLECRYFIAQVNNWTISSVDLARLVVGRAGVELLDYLDEHFPE